MDDLIYNRLYVAVPQACEQVAMRVCSLLANRNICVAPTYNNIERSATSISAIQCLQNEGLNINLNVRVIFDFSDVSVLRVYCNINNKQVLLETISSTKAILAYLKKVSTNNICICRNSVLWNILGGVLIEERARLC